MFLSSLTWGEHESVGWSAFTSETSASKSTGAADDEDVDVKDSLSSRSINKSDKVMEMFRASADKQFFLGVLDKINSKGMFPRYYSLSQSFSRRCINVHSDASYTSDRFWGCLPVGVHPSGGHIPADRIARKVNQVENMMELCIILIEAAIKAKEERANDYSSTAEGDHLDKDNISEADSDIASLESKLQVLVDEIQRHELTHFDNSNGDSIDIRERLVSVLTRLEGELKDIEIKQAHELEDIPDTLVSTKVNKKKSRVKNHYRRIQSFKNIVSSWLSEFDDLTSKITASISDSNSESRAPSNAGSCREGRRRSKLKVVEFCAGSGFVVLPLAALYPEFEFVLVDRKGPSLIIGKQRVREARLKNVTIIQGDIEDFNDKFDVGISLHACGPATDITIEKCIKQKASLVCCSCCVGKITSARSQFLSGKMASVASDLDFKHAIRAADFGHQDSELYGEVDMMRRICKSYIELDRQMYLNESGYSTKLVVMSPKSASPKNDMIIGWVNRDRGRDAPTNELNGSTTDIVDSYFQRLTEDSNDSLKSYLFS